MEPLLGPAADDRLHVMTYNLRYPADDPGHLWDERRPAMAALLNLERPAVIGVQEGYVHQLRDVVADLPAGYHWIGEGRDGGGRGECTAIVYDGTRLGALRYAHFWLSDTPDVPGSATWGNSVPRMATWVRFHDAATGGEFVVLNTHLDHRSGDARRKAASLLAATAESVGAAPVVVTGDFNAAAGSSTAYDSLVSGAGLSDAWRAARLRLTPEYATYGGYRTPVLDRPRIDWILTTADIETEAIAINPNMFDGRYPSDHLPVHAHVRLP